jgi:diacylglycerol kinase (ATP)
LLPGEFHFYLIDVASENFLQNMKSNLIVANPTSGKGKGARILAGTLDYCEKFRAPFQVIAASSLEKSLAELSRKDFSLIERVFVVGGDGMVHHVINELSELLPKKIPIGIIPAGTGNDFARALNLDIKKPIRNLDFYLSHEPSAIDLGEVNGVRFGAICSTGFDSIVNERANQMRWPAGRRKYDLAMIQELPRFKPRLYQIEIDDSMCEVRAMLIAVGNGSSYGGGMKVCPDAKITDGLLDIMILKPVPKFEFLRIFPSVYSGNHIRHPQVEILRGSRIVIRGEAVTYADGERIAPTPVEIKVLPRALLTWSEHD